MATALIANGTLLLPHELVDGGWLKIEDGRIADFGPSPAPEKLQADSTIDAAGALIAPGFIDVHTHGFLRRSVQEGPEGLRAMSAELPTSGVTSFLPTLMPLAPDRFPQFVRDCGRATANPPGARMPGLHLEGPFLARTGAIPPDVLRGLDLAYLEKIIDAAGQYMAAMSVSPDFPDAIALARRIREAGAKPFVTHTEATFEQAQALIDAVPEIHGTHFYDVFHTPEWHEPGTTPVGAIEAFLLNDRATVDMIVDGVHVHPALIKLTIKVKGVDHCALCTDANIGAGLPFGDYTMPNGTVIEIGASGGARDKKQRWLMGSALTMNRGFVNLIELIGLSPVDAARMAATIPAWILGLDDRGSIQRGKLADLVILQRDGTVRCTLVGGSIVYESS